MEKPQFVLGIDPGKTGAMAIFTKIEERYYLQDIVDFENTIEILWMFNRKLDTAIEELDCMAFLENVHAAPGQGVSAMFNFGKNFGWWQGVLNAFNIPFMLVAPQSWSPKMLGRTTDKKNKSREVATKLFSRDHDAQVDDRGNPFFALKKNDGRADAALIGWYGIQKLLNR